MNPSHAIVVIDDEPHLLRSFLRTLRHAGYDVSGVGSGTEGLGLIRRRHPDLVLLDVDLPDMDGVEACQQIKADPELTNTYVVLLSGTRVKSAQQAKGLESRADGYIVKPIASRELLARIQAFLRLRDTQMQLAQALNELKVKNEALRRSQETAHALLNATIDVALLVDPQGTVLEANQTLAQRIGRRVEDLLGTNIYTFFPPELAAARKTAIEQIVRTGQPIRYKDRNPLSGVMTDNSLYPIFDEDGHVERIAIFAQDITARKHAEEQLRKLSTAVEQSPSMVVITNLDGQIEYVNPEFTAVTGYTSEEAVGQNPRLLKSDQQDPSVYQDLWQTIRAEQIWRGEWLNRKKNGDLYWESAAISPIKQSHGQITHYLKVAQDITARKHSEQESARAKEVAEHARKAAEAANQAKSEFLANMSHELRTPLNGILGYAQILKHDPDLTDKQREEAEIIQRSGDHLLTLLNDILDLSKIEAGKFELHATIFNLSAALRTIVEMTRLRAHQHGLIFTYDLDPDVPDEVLGDEKCLRQILLNLLGNAVKFTEQGSVTFRVTKLETGDSHLDSEIPPLASSIQPSASSIQHPVTIRFEVEDTGIGIPAEQVERIFSPFEQLKDHRLYSEGTGLGLAISRRLSRMMGGELYVKSRVDDGSTFWFDVMLPVVMEHQVEPQAPSRRIIGFRQERCTVLIVDDKAENRSVLKDMLVPLGFTALESASGQQTLNIVNEISPDMVLLDIVMPEITGFEVATLLRNNPKLQETVIIGVSASAFERTRQQSLNAGCHDFLSKPVVHEQLLTLLQRYLTLDWIYADAQPIAQANTDTEILPPPQEVLKRLHDLAIIGDIMGIRELGAHIDALDDPQFKPFAKKINTLAKALKIGEIQQFLRAYLEQLDEEA